jgi:predicted HAD superfamily Cof-like phosphohydrolase
VEKTKGANQMSLDWFQDVFEFHKKLAPSIPRELPEVPKVLHKADYKYGFGFMEEEMDEVLLGMQAGNIEEVADGLVDLIYVTCRVALIWGIDLRPIWEEVHQANMLKEGGETRADGKLLKPINWIPPNITKVLAEQKPLR